MQKLKLSKETIQVLKNFNTINPMIYFKKGSSISTMSPGKTILAKYDCAETFESDFGIYKLDKLLSILSFFDDPEIIIGDKNLTVKSDQQSAKIAFADPSVLVYPQKDKIDLPTIEAEFNLKEEHINAITKAFSVMELPFVAFECDGAWLRLKALNPKDPNSDDYTIDLQEVTGPSFIALFNVNNLKLIPADYHVRVSGKGIAEFSNDKMLYFIAVEKDSEFA
jgi:hypothetical protein